MSTSSIPLRRAPSSDVSATKERLLDAAERLFAERGFEGTSMRAVTQSAGASVSAANYHFGSKEELLRATLWRRIGPVNERRLERLDELDAAREAPSLEIVLDAFLRPLFEVRAERLAAGQLADDFRQIAARLYSDPPELVESLRQELFGEINDRMHASLARSLPDTAPENIALAHQLTVGVMVHVISGQLDASTSSEPILEKMIVYAAAGIRAATAPEGGAG